MNGVTSSINKYIHEIQTFILWHYTRGSVYDTPFWREAQAETISIFEHPTFNVENEKFQNIVWLASQTDYIDCRAGIKTTSAQGPLLMYGQWGVGSIKYWYDEYIKNL